MPLEDCHVGILGLGLIGGSLGGALIRQNLPGVRILGADLDEKACEGALEKACIHQAVSSEILAASSDILILAVPPRHMESVSRMMRPLVSRKLKAVFDLGSVKGEPGEKLEEIWGSPYVGLHPMAGKEVGGIAQAEPELFRNCLCFLVPRKNSDPLAVELGREIIRGLGAVCSEISPEEHDLLVAYGSHLPMVTAAALSLAAGRKSRNLPGISRAVAGGFRDATRTASGMPWLGADVLRYNRKALTEAVRECITFMEEFLAASPEEGEALFQEAAGWRREILEEIQTRWKR